MKRFLPLFSLIILFSCKEKDEALSAQNIIDKAIEVACKGTCEHANIDFTFRDRQYSVNRNGGSYRYQRISSDSTGTTVDVLTNTGFTRERNNKAISVPDSMAVKYSNSINSVVYFAQLPFGLNAPAVKKELLGVDLVNNEQYYEIQVSFEEEGGGADFEDIFVYWVHKDKFTVDFFAYQYEVDGGGIRFREAYNPRVLNGIRFVDYNNYKPENLDVTLSDLDTLFEQGTLKLLSKIETENVSVEIINAN